MAEGTPQKIYKFYTTIFFCYQWDTFFIFLDLQDAFFHHEVTINFLAGTIPDTNALISVQFLLIKFTYPTHVTTKC